MLFWWIVPFGWIISVSKMRYGIPAYVMLGAICLAVVTTPSTSGLSTEKQIAAGFANGQKYGLVGSVIGSAITVREILESRRKIKA
jgi:NADH:ubiquinone oxidoreductase subunit H